MGLGYDLTMSMYVFHVDRYASDFSGKKNGGNELGVHTWVLGLTLEIEWGMGSGYCMALGGVVRGASGSGLRVFCFGAI